jgi:hypothetical protein
MQDHMAILVDGKPIAVAKVTEMEDKSFVEQCTAVRILGFSLFVKRAKVGAAKHVRVRPRFEKWELRGTVEVIAKEIQEIHLRQMFEIAGFYKGLCDWRPGSQKAPGRFGRYTPELKRVD